MPNPAPILNMLQNSSDEQLAKLLNLIRAEQARREALKARDVAEQEYGAS